MIYHYEANVCVRIMDMLRAELQDCTLNTGQCKRVQTSILNRKGCTVICEVLLRLLHKHV